MEKIMMMPKIAVRKKTLFIAFSFLLRFLPDMRGLMIFFVFIFFLTPHFFLQAGLRRRMGGNDYIISRFPLFGVLL